MKNTLDIDFVRKQFPAFQNPKTANFAFFENAGGTYVPKQLIEKLNDFMITKKVQPYGDFGPSIEAGQEMDKSLAKIAELLNVSKDEFIIGPSTTMNMFLLSNAIQNWLDEGDEIIVTLIKIMKQILVRGESLLKGVSLLKNGNLIQKLLNLKLKN